MLLIDKLTTEVLSYSTPDITWHVDQANNRVLISYDLYFKQQTYVSAFKNKIEAIDDANKKLQLLKERFNTNVIKLELLTLDKVTKTDNELLLESSDYLSKEHTMGGEIILQF